jgi:hypothetical protein
MKMKLELPALLAHDIRHGGDVRLFQEIFATKGPQR